MKRTRIAAVAALAAALCIASGVQPVAQRVFTLEQVLAPAYPYELVSAARADRIAWLSYEEGRRNVYTAAAPQLAPLRLTDVRADDGIDLTSLNISADGSIVTFVRGHNPNRDGWVANPASDPRGAERIIWAARTSGGKPWRLGPGTNPVLSPDGKWVAFARDGQIHAISVSQNRGSAGSTAEQPLFRAYGSNTDPVWSPDGKRIAFVSNRGDHSFIGVYDLTHPRVTYLSPAVDRDSSPAWSPDGRQVAFIRRPGQHFSQITAAAAARAGAPGGGRPGFPPGGREGPSPVGGRQGGPPAISGLANAAFAGGYTISFWVAEAATGQGREFWHNAAGDTEWTGINRIRWAGNHVVFQLERHNWEHYYSVAVRENTDAPVDLTPGEGMAEQVGFSADGAYLYYCTNVGDIDRRHLWRTPIAGGTPRQLTHGEKIDTYPAVLASGGQVAVLNAGPAQPQSVAVVAASGGEPRVIFPKLAAEFPIADQVTPQNITLKAPDGLEFNNQIFLPRDLRAGERRPAIIFTHGGPARQMLLGYHYRHFYHMAYAINQYLANRGYVVLSVNYRSGIGYGTAFRRAERTGARGNAEYQDLLAAGQYMKTRDDVDPERIGLWGLSYGGLLTAQGLARNSDLFAAGVDLAGVHLWGNSLDAESVSFQSSPIAEIGKWKSPVLLIHGDDDRNVAFSQTTGLVQLLRAHNVYHELIVFPDDVHDSLLYSRWLQAFQAMEDFFTRFLKNRKSSTQ